MYFIRSFYFGAYQFLKIKADFVKFVVKPKGILTRSYFAYPIKFCSQIRLSVLEIGSWKHIKFLKINDIFGVRCEIYSNQS